MKILYSINEATETQICTHLLKCCDCFIPPLSTRVNIPNFALKIRLQAVTFEAWDSGILVGMISAYFNDEDNRVGFINNVSVLNNFTGMGIANRLLHMCIAYAEKIAFSEVALEVASRNCQAIRLYSNQGFSIFKRKEDVIIMKLRIFSAKI